MNGAFNQQYWKGPAFLGWLPSRDSGFFLQVTGRFPSWSTAALCSISTPYENIRYMHGDNYFCIFISVMETIILFLYFCFIYYDCFLLLFCTAARVLNFLTRPKIFDACMETTIHLWFAHISVSFIMIVFYYAFFELGIIHHATKSECL